MIEFPFDVTEDKYYNWYCNIIEKCTSRIKPEGHVEKHHIIPRSFGGDNSKENLVTLTPREHFIVHLLLVKMNFPTKQHKQMLHAYMSMATAKKKYRQYKVNSRTYDLLRREFAKHIKEISIFSGPNNPGINPSIETRKKMSDSTKKKFLDPEFRKKYDEGLSKRVLDKELISKRTKEGMAKPEARKRYLEGFAKRVVVYTEESTRKMIESKRKNGTLNPTEETKRKISQSNMGKTRSLEARKKLSETQKRQYASGERQTWNKGKTGYSIHSEETRKKMSEYRKGKKHSMSQEGLENLREMHRVIRTCPNCNHTGQGVAMLRWHFDNCKKLKPLESTLEKFLG